jgi:adenosylcobinamide-GDP ribazoletransferase
VLFRFRLALQFLTRIPLTLPRAPVPDEMAGMLAYYPAVGLLLGFLGAGLGDALVTHGRASPLLAGVLVVTLGIVLTGGLHLDGVADTFDGLMSGRTGAEAGAIMKDSRVGAMGAVALVVVILVKVVATAALLEQGRVWVVVLAPAVGRCWAVVVAWSGRPPDWVREGIGRQMAGHLTVTTGVLACVTLLAAAVPLGWPAWWLFPVLGGWAAGAAVTRRAQRVVGGVTGDVLGAGIEAAEAGALVVAALAWV